MYVWQNAGDKLLRENTEEGPRALFIGLQTTCYRTPNRAAPHPRGRRARAGARTRACTKHGPRASARARRPSAGPSPIPPLGRVGCSEFCFSGRCPDAFGGCRAPVLDTGRQARRSPPNFQCRVPSMVPPPRLLASGAPCGVHGGASRRASCRH